MTGNKALLTMGGLVLLLGLSFAAYQVYATRLAHTTFERYYAFRECTELVDRTDTYADCKLADGSVIKLVLINSKWYLDGDGPGVW